MNIALLGYGRFGRALTELILDSGRVETSGDRVPWEASGVGLRAFDPHWDVPAPIRAGSLAELVQGATHLVLAIPVPKTEEVLEQLLPLLERNELEGESSPLPLVVDVGSVKRGPVRAMERILGERVPWIATHPLFGPSSVVLGERPLRVVVCPNSHHPRAAEEARLFFEGFGCRVVEQSADEHDRVMAKTHALAFFLAKGLLDIEADADLPFSPPSFQAMAKTVESVRSDAGHLFLAIQNENPYAEASRRELLGALTKLHGRLVAARDSGTLEANTAPASTSHSGSRKDGETTTSDPDPLAIPDLGERAFELREARELIDDVDRELVVLLARRAELSRRAGRIKSKARRATQDPKREQELIATRRDWAQSLGIDPSWIQEAFELILEFSRSIQDEDKQNGEAG